MHDKLDPLTLFILAFITSALAGFGALLRTTTELTWRTMTSAILNSGALGLVMALLLFTWFKDNAWFLLGLCMLAGMGGMTVVGFVVWLLRQGGANIEINIKDRQRVQNPIHENDDSVEHEETQ